MNWRNPFRVLDLLPFTQGSCCAPTLGWRAESRWDYFSERGCVEDQPQHESFFCHPTFAGALPLRLAFSTAALRNFPCLTRNAVDLSAKSWLSFSNSPRSTQPVYASRFESE